jgi:predicted GH43/DUF377 family glycosyl hydrolase
MKRILLFTVILFSLLLNSCSSQAPVSPDSDSQQGGISLNIDRLHKPENVISVTAYLIREGYDTLSGTLNLISDTTADITFNDVPAGDWHLKVDASDEDTVVVYSGETDVNILAGITTQVSLILQPTGVGAGCIYIYVTWGVPPNTSWIDYQNNPILSPSMLPVIPNAVSHPCVLSDDGMYKMWFAAFNNSAVANIWYAVSNDGINWELGSNHSVLVPSSYWWDSQNVCSPRVIKDGNNYRMYYTGFADEYGEWDIGLATSSDGINWTKHGDPVVNSDYNEFQIQIGDVLKVNDVYYLYYAVHNLPYYKISLATSTDGVNFIKSANNPVLIVNESWEGTGVKSPSVIYENGQYTMIYSAFPETGFGMAYSSDGINWIKDTNNPLFRLEDISNNWCQAIAYPFWRKLNDQYRIYYQGNFEGGNAESKIGFIYK